LQTDKSPRQYRGIAHALSTVLKEEGPRALYKGWLPSVIGVVSEWLGFYCFHQSLIVHLHHGCLCSYAWMSKLSSALEFAFPSLGHTYSSMKYQAKISFSILIYAVSELSVCLLNLMT